MADKMEEESENAEKPTRTKRERPASSMDRKGGRPNKKVDKPTLVEVAAEKYAKGAMHYSVKKIQFKGLRKTMEEANSKIRAAAMRTAGNSLVLLFDVKVITGISHICYLTPGC
jgi:hypothetical protein